MATDDFFLLRSPHGVVVVPSQLDLGVVGIAARHSEKHLAGVERHHVLNLLREQDRWFVGRGSEDR